MNQGIRTVIYPVKDIGRGKALFSNLLGVAPYADTAYTLALGLETKK